MSNNENFENCKRIANDLEKYYSGVMYRNINNWDIVEDTDELDLGNNPDYEQLSLYDYFDDVYNIEYRVNSYKEYSSVEIMIACGGPNIYIDTKSKQVELYWWGDNAAACIDYDVCNEIDNIFEEQFAC